ncbi:MAG: hypothetical protein DHS20C13_22210 [Thermodesulfobacteriota bacterium]|nr:MAG: hypothetical protein DHS20C13_22210 [Thermodesulfobacteriota bacterium]GJM35917.1 MAG: hypothetical protein DHS20C18_49180 [Saprospiraceae bacterium]
MANHTLGFHPLAREEVREAYQFYESRKSGLGDLFFRSLDDLFLQILDNPNLYPQDFETIRKAPLRKFPFTVYYEVIDDQVLVYSVFHQKRNPEEWLGRVQ